MMGLPREPHRTRPPPAGLGIRLGAQGASQIEHSDRTAAIRRLEPVVLRPLGMVPQSLCHLERRHCSFQHEVERDQVNSHRANGLKTLVARVLCRVCIDDQSVLGRHAKLAVVERQDLAVHRPTSRCRANVPMCRPINIRHLRCTPSTRDRCCHRVSARSSRPPFPIPSSPFPRPRSRAHTLAATSLQSPPSNIALM